MTFTLCKNVMGLVHESRLMKKLTVNLINLRMEEKINKFKLNIGTLIMGFWAFARSRKVAIGPRRALHLRCFERYIFAKDWASVA